ncbi:hypothetical protein SAMN05444162_4334 [Paenibacillaceae bacterium GAS479]|nr:hypothetical protein SAMN05444162_4334 [Paenibacillaceae bacterium GAS479]
MNYEQVEISNSKGSNMGMILVLFILLVIVTSLFHTPVGGENLQEDNLPGIQSSQGFNVINNTSELLLQSTSFEGDFQSPGPAPHTLQPGGGSYHFEVTGSILGYKSAYAYYNVTSGSYYVVGKVTVTMNVENGYAWRISATGSGSISVTTSGRNAIVRNA